MTTTPLANWNGRQMPLDEVMVPALDRGFLFGDAVYEVIRVYKGRAWKLNDHLSRLKLSLDAIKIESIDHDQIRRDLIMALKASCVRQGLIYIQITRGAAPRTHAFPKAATPNILIYVDQFDDQYKEERKNGIQAITFADIRWARNEIKATSLLANCLAAQAAAEAGCREAILIDSQGMVTEGSHTSVFAVQNNKIVVSPAAPNILPGITKRQVLDLAKKSQIDITEKRLQKNELWQCDEVFITGTPEEILPVAVIDQIPVKNGQPGPITQKLQQTFELEVQSWLSTDDA